MKTLWSVVGALSIFVASASAASDQWYIGATQGYFSLGEGDHWAGDIEIGQAGLQIGKFLTDDLSVEVSYGVNFNRNDFGIASLSGLVWMGDSADQYRPYLLVGTNRYAFDDEQGLPIQHYHSQLVVGGGIGSEIADKLQLRADVRVMGGNSENKDDFGLQFSINRLFDTTPAPAAEIVEPVADKTVVKPKLNTVTIQLNVEFEFDSAKVLAVYGDQLEVIAAGMHKHKDIQLVLEGHTDSLGSGSYNDDLSVRRAESVKVKLAEDYGISFDRIATTGYGEGQPIASNELIEGRARNRRVIGEMSFSEVVVD